MTRDCGSTEGTDERPVGHSTKNHRHRTSPQERVACPRPALHIQPKRKASLLAGTTRATQACTVSIAIMAVPAARGLPQSLRPLHASKVRVQTKE